MNIIQMQDKLKDLSNKQLMYYIENPQISSGAMTGSSLGQGGANTLPGAMLAGHVPAYLVIGELGRREEMRKKDQTPPTETVAEEIVAKAQGLGSLGPTSMTPQLPPQEETMSESITETGVATLPAPNIGQNYAGGGIVYTDGTQGYPIGGLIVPAVMGAGRFLGGTALGKGVGKGLGFLKDKLIGTKGTYNPASQAKGTNVIPYNPSAVANQSLYGTQGLLTKPGALLGLGVDTAVIGGITYTLLPDGKIVDEEGNPPPPEVTEKITEESTITETIPAPKSDEDIAKERMDMYKNLLGEDEGLTAIESRLGKIEERAQNREDQALNDALIRGGLGMAAGQSQNFLENLAAGATAGIDSYDKSLDDMRDSEKEIFAIEVELNKAKRAEQVAIASKGIDSIEARTAAKEAMALQNQKDNAAYARTLATVQATQQLSEKDLIDAYTASGGFDAVTQQQLPYPDWKRNLLGQLPIDTPEIQSLLDKYAS